MKLTDKLVRIVNTQKYAVAFVVGFGIIGTFLLLSSFADTPITCDRTANSSAALATQVLAATAGQTICLSTANYGAWAGTNKAITVAAASGQSPQMQINFTTGDSGFTLDGMTNMSGIIQNSANNITIKNSEFTGELTLTNLANSNILFDHNTHNNINCVGSNGSCTPAARVHLNYDSPTFSGVTIQNSEFFGGDSDGIQTGVGVNIFNNEFKDLLQDGINHTDPIQLIDAVNSVVRGNYIHNTADGIVAYDGISHALIEDNVIDLGVEQGRWGLELYSDDSSIVRHNTLVYTPEASSPNGNKGCSYGPCGYIILDRKLTDPVGHGTQIYDNIFSIMSMQDSSTAAAQHHNLISGNLDNHTGGGATAQDIVGSPTYVGGAHPTTFAGFALTAGSLGYNAASDGTDIGADVSGGLTSPPDTTPPDTTITSNPASSTTSTSASFSFTSTESGSTFECKLDTGSYASCTSPKAYTGLSVASHTFSVRATDSASNTDASPDTYTWTIAAPGVVLGDFNADGHVNIFDLGIFLSHYGQNNITYDLNNDVNHAVNVFDLGIFLNNYGT